MRAQSEWEASGTVVYQYYWPSSSSQMTECADYIRYLARRYGCGSLGRRFICRVRFAVFACAKT